MGSIEKLAEELDVTPVRARHMLQIWETRKAEYPGEDHSHARLDPTKFSYSRIIDALGWLPGGSKEGARPVTPVGGGAGRACRTLC